MKVEIIELCKPNDWRQDNILFGEEVACHDSDNCYNGCQLITTITQEVSMAILFARWFQTIKLWDDIFACVRAYVWFSI